MPPEPTQRLAFREMTEADLDDVAALLGDPEVMTHYPRPKSRDEARSWIDWNRGLYRGADLGLWLLERRGDGAFVGDCGLTPQEVDGAVEIELGYHVRRALQGHGYATEAAAACLDHARDRLGQRRVVALIAPDNRASQRVAENVGIAHERDTIGASGRVVQVYAIVL
jgi:RimJ/RimL family protein N-acetyltransferase